MDVDISRRGFVAGAAAVLTGCQARTSLSAAPFLSAVKGPTVLFQGDSITHSGRSESTDEGSASSLGYGYPLLIAASLLGSAAGAPMRFVNRGVSGNRSDDLVKRWSADTIDLQPSVLSLLVGVNDYAHMRGGFYHGTVRDFENAYDQLLSEARTALPAAKLIVLEPFLLGVGQVNSSWFSGFTPYRLATRRAAFRANAAFVELQQVFEQLSSEREPSHWSRDGIHPTLAGHCIIAECWRAAARL